MYSVWPKFSLSFTNYYINMDVVYLKLNNFIMEMDRFTY